MSNPSVILTPIAADSGTKRLPPLTDSAAGVGRVSQQQGFPPITQQPLEVGGKAPQRDDMNGVLNLLSQHTVHLQSGGQYLYNPALQYDTGCVIALDDGITLVQSLVDDNPTNPNAGLGADWRSAGADVQARIWARRYAGLGISITASVVLTPDDVGRWADISAAATTTLPSADAVPEGSTFVLKNTHTDFVPVNSLGGNVGGVSSYQLAPGGIVELAANTIAGGGWVITSQSILGSGGSGDLIGVPIPYPLPTPPIGYLVMAGQAFNALTYPLLAAVYPGLVLPDLRGEFIRGWDNGLGVDPGRALLSPQDDAYQAHTHPAANGWTQVISGFNGAGGISDGFGGGMGHAPMGAGTGSASETRPRNVAFNYICRAK